MTYLVARGLISAPFLEIYEMDASAETPSEPFTLIPPPASVPKLVRFPRNNSQMAIVTEFRRENTEGIGSPAEVIPTAGLRKIAPNDSYILFGGAPSVDGVLYQRRGPGYMRFDMAVPPGVYAMAAEFSNSSRYLFFVGSDAPDEIRVLRQSGMSFGLIHTITVSHAVTRIIIDQGENYVIASGSSDFTVFEFLDSVSGPFPEVVGAPSGKLVDASRDNRWYVVVDGGAVKVYEHSAGNWSYVRDLISPPASIASGRFSGDGSMLAVVGAKAVFYSTTGGAFHRAGESTGTPFSADNYEFSPDSESLMIGVSDGVEMYERDLVPTNSFFNDVPPVDLSAYSDPRINISRNGQFMTARRNDGGFDVFEWNPSTKVHEFRGSSAEIVSTTPWYGFPISDDGRFVVHAAVSFGAVYEWDGTEYQRKQTLPAQSGLYGYFVVSISPDGNRFAVSVRGSNETIPNPTRLDVYEYAPGTDAFVRITNRSFNQVSTHQLTSLAFSDDGDAIFVNVVGTTNSCFISRANNDFATSLLSISGSGTYTPLWVGSDVIINRATVSPFTRLYTYNSAANTYSLISEAIHGLPQDFSSGHYNDGQMGVVFNSDNIIAVRTITHPYVECFTRSGNTFTELPPFNEDLSTFPRLMARIGDDRLYLGQNEDIKVYLDPPPVEYRRYNMQLVRSLGSASNRVIGGFSPDGSLFSADYLHFDTNDFTTPLAEVPFDDEYAASQIRDVLWGSTGRFVLYSNPDGPSVSVLTRGTDGFTMSKKLSGLFVAKYVRNGDVLTEVDYVVHDVEDVLSDMVFSDTGVAMGYFLSGDEATKGRYIYNTVDDFLELKGVHTLPAMEASFMAFSPHESHFVTTYRMSDNAHDLRLFSLGPDRSFTQEDQTPTDFGTVDISWCDQVIVAHGGEPPFSLWQIDDMQLVPQPFPLVDWEHGGFIWDVVFDDDCVGLYVITPTELILIDLEEGEVLDIDEHEMDEESEGSTGRGGNGMSGSRGSSRLRRTGRNGTGGSGRGGRGGTGGGGGAWNGGRMIENVTYYSHSTVHVTHRS